MKTDKAGSPLVSVTVPTCNSASTLDAALRSVQVQTYPNIELIVVDSHSRDATSAIAENRGAQVIQIHGRLLKARQVGVLAAMGAFVLLLDSDQILERTALERAVLMGQQGPFDMLFLEEHSYHPHNWLQRLFEMDRRVIHETAMTDAETGVMLPRFFKREILLEALSAIPVDELIDVVAQDHAIIHWEASKITQRAAIVSNAVYHMDPSDVVYVLKHFYSKGKVARKLERNQAYLMRYKDMFEAKSRSRGIGMRSQLFAPASNLVLLMKGVPYLVGKWLG